MINTGRAKDPSKRELLVVSALLGVAAAAMLLHGLGYISLDVLKPNKGLSSHVFVLAGVFLAGGAILAGLKVMEASRGTIDIAGWTTVGASLALMTLLAFEDPAQASCTLSGTSIMVIFNSCGFAFKSLALAVDVAAVLIFAGWATKSLRRRA